MKIQKDLAQEIVENLRDTINQDINFMNDQGIIIASTDSERIGSFHGASLNCIKKRQIITISFDGEYEGAKKGINLPVNFNNDVIGVIGISGDLEEVEKYGTIIKKMTEILLKEEWIKENQTIEREDKRNLIESLIHNKINDYDFIPLEIENNKKFIAISQIRSNDMDINKRENILRFIESNFKKAYIYPAIIHNELIILYLSNSKDEIKKNLNLITNHMKKSYDLDLSFGVSNDYSTVSNSKTFYKQAVRAYDWIKTFDRFNNILFYEEMGLGLLVTSIDEKDLYEYSYKILKNIDNDDLAFYKDLIKLYGQCNGSITKISEELFMHKNSIQYRLNKLEEITGYNPRKINDYIVLWFAFLSLES